MDLVYNDPQSIEKRDILLQENKTLTHYHLDALQIAKTVCGLKGQRVLEVGGSMPKNVVFGGHEVARWFSVEDFDYWNELPSHSSGPHYDKVQNVLANASAPDTLPSHNVFRGKIEDLPIAFHGQFDRIFSVACFEHVHNLGYALEKMWDALCPGGKLFSLFTPIWSAHDGHHLPEITDKQGNTYKFGQSPIPPWGHLMMTPPEMFSYLCKKTDSETAGKMVYYVYHSPHINRLFAENYVEYFSSSKFKTQLIGDAAPMTGQEETLKILRKLHPRYSKFLSNGLVVVLEKKD